MEIIIAVLLGLILVALMAANKEAARAVFGTLRGVFVALVLLVVWGILIGGTVHHYLSYTEQKWYHTFGIVMAVLLPPILLWAYRGWVRVTLARGTKTVLKYLAVLLFGVAFFVGWGVLYQEWKKIEPNIGWIILFAGLGITGVVLIGMGLSEGWKEAFTFPPHPQDTVNRQYEARLSSEFKKWLDADELLEKTGASREEIANLSYEHDALRYSLEQEWFRELDKVRDLKQPQNYWLLAFYMFIFYIFLGLLGIAWDYGFAYVQRFF